MPRAKCGKSTERTVDFYLTEYTADAARELGVSRARVARLCASGLLDSWRDGTRRMVTRDSVEARKADMATA